MTDFSSLFGVSRDSADLVGIAVNAVKAGYAVLPVAPGGKNPLCTLTATARKKADKAASERAKLSGHKGWMNVRHSNSGECGVKHAITDPNLAGRVFKRLLADHPDLNIALEVGKSKMLCVDADTAEQVETFTRMWAGESGHPGLQFVQPTVLSPGKVKASGEWTHKNGGHFWFELPDDIEFDSATVSTALVLPGGAAAYFKDRVLLVPPSVRPEGSYVLQSDPGLAPRWLIDKVIMHIEGFTERRKIHRDKISIDNDPIDVWSADTTWASLLEPDGWTSSQKFDSCQCEIWTRPGEDWSSPKSATAHEPGCTQWEAEKGHSFLHIWTDDAPQFLKDYANATGSRSLSKVQYVAWRDHNGSNSKAMRELGLERVTTSPTEAWKMFISDPDESGDAGTSVTHPDTSGWGDLVVDAEEDAEEVELDDREAFRALLRANTFTRSELARVPEPSWIVEGWIPRTSVIRMSGAPGSLKSFVALDMLLCIATGRRYHGAEVERGRVLYLAAEGAPGVKLRISAWEQQTGITVDDGWFKVVAMPVQTGSAIQWGVFMEEYAAMNTSLIALDTQARITSGFNENSAEHMGIFNERIDELKRVTGASTLTIHHSGHTESDRGRGSSAVWGAVDVELMLKRDKAANRAELTISKSKDAEEDLKLTFEAVKLVVGVDSKGRDKTSLVLKQTANEAPRDPLVEENVAILALAKEMDVHAVPLDLSITKATAYMRAHLCRGLSCSLLTPRKEIISAAVTYRKNRPVAASERQPIVDSGAVPDGKD